MARTKNLATEEIQHHKFGQAAIFGQISDDVKVELRQLKDELQQMKQEMREEHITIRNTSLKGM